MGIIIVLLSVAVIAGIAAILRIMTPIRLCPICAGVSGTWLGMLAVRAIGVPVDSVLLALLMGGSVVGIGYQLRSLVPTGRSAAWFLGLFTIAALAAADGIIRGSLSTAAVGAVVAGLITAVFLSPPRASIRTRGPDVTAIEKKLENCCS